MSDNTPQEQKAGAEEALSMARTGWWAGGWFAPIVVTGFTLFWILMIYALVGDRPRTWQYAPPPYVPAESVATSMPFASFRPFPASKLVELPKKAPGGTHAAR